MRSLVNLVVVGGVIDPEDTGDREERDECVKMHGLIKEYKLQVCQWGQQGCVVYRSAGHGRHLMQCCAW